MQFCMFDYFGCYFLLVMLMLWAIYSEQLKGANGLQTNIEKMDPKILITAK